MSTLPKIATGLEGIGGVIRGACLLGLIAGLSARPALATSTIAESDQSTLGSATAYDGDISTHDLINSGQSSLASASEPGDIYATGGPHDGTPSAGYWNYAGTPATLTYTLNTNPFTGGSATGYSITGVRLINGFDSTPSYVNQIWTIKVATVDAPSTFVTLDSVSYLPFSDSENFNDPHSSMVLLTDPNGPLAGDLITATGIAAVQFVVSSGGPFGFLNRELDVLGYETVPEPASLTLLGIGAALLWFRRRHQR